MAPKKIRLHIAYDGSGFHGWQTQPGLRTVQGTIVDFCRSFFNDSSARIHGASRTDAGVSALGQVALLIVRTPIPIDNIARVLNEHLPWDIAIVSAHAPPREFDIIGGVRKKLYRYSIYTGPVRPVLHIRHCWHLPVNLNIDEMNRAAGHLVGKMNFISFASAADKRKSTVRTVFRCDVTREDEWVHVDIEGDGFLLHMVRNITGTLTDIGMGKMSPDDMPEIIKAEDRTAAGTKAPAAGLCLMWIKH